MRRAGTRRDRHDHVLSDGRCRGGLARPGTRVHEAHRAERLEPLQRREQRHLVPQVVLEPLPAFDEPGRDVEPRKVFRALDQ